MIPLDSLDQRLLSALRANGRASVAGLAKQLSVARGTIQTRLDRLVAHGVIHHFTIEVAEAADGATVRAFCSIRLTHANTGRTFERLRELPAVRDLYTTNGKWDLVLDLRAASLDELDTTLAAIRAIPIVAETETSILLRRL